MQVEPQDEHRWLQKLVGTWTYVNEASMGPDQPPIHSSGTDQVRPYGEVWIICDSEGGMPDGAIGHMQMTLGFDTAKKKFVGTFLGTMMTNLWVYEGTLDAAGKVLTLVTQGPSFTDDGTLSTYHDTITMEDDDHRTLTSQVLGADGKWTQFMTVRYTRVKS